MIHDGIITQYQFSKEVLLTRHQAASTLLAVVKSHGNLLVVSFVCMWDWCVADFSVILGEVSSNLSTLSITG